MNNIEIKISNELINYESSLNFMQCRINTIKSKNHNELLWFLEHDHIYTQGTSTKDGEIIKKNHINIIKTNRGGKTTYHGPGQRIVYFMINLNNRKKDIRGFITLLEDSLIKLLSVYNIDSRSFKDRVGIWVTKSNGLTLDKEEKIGAIGLRITKWITYHGLSFNINPDLDYYNYINACGLDNYKNTSLKKLGIHIEKKEFDKNFKEIFLNKLKNF